MMAWEMVGFWASVGGAAVRLSAAFRVCVALHQRNDHANRNLIYLVGGGIHCVGGSLLASCLQDPLALEQSATQESDHPERKSYLNHAHKSPPNNDPTEPKGRFQAGTGALHGGQHAGR